MVNKLTIESAYKLNPSKTYFVIQNPKIDPVKKKVLGVSLKSVEYRVKDWDQKEVRFEKVDFLKDKKFPEIIIFDKRYPDAENEVYAERVSRAKNKDEVYDSYAIFVDVKMADYHKLIRLHRLSEELIGIYAALKEKKATNENADYEPQILLGDSNSSKKNKKKVSMIDIKKFFDEVQETNYFENLELIQSDNPDLAVK